MLREELTSRIGISRIGDEMHQLISQLYPICRSITGEGIRRTLDVLRKHLELTVYEVPTGTKVFDWRVPREWNIRDAYIKNSLNERVVDFQKSNLHVLNYSKPVKGRMSLGDLKGHLYSVPERPDWIPYRTSYYKEDWGFCLSYNQYLQLTEGYYEVVIDSTLEDGFLTYAEHVISGRESDEFLLSCHICHPSLCNDNLSGIALATFLAKALGTIPLRYSYRFVFVPGTIGSITWLSLNEAKVSRIKHGLVVACVGDPGPVTYKRSRRHTAMIDRAVAQVLKHSGMAYRIRDFSPYGYDERQYCSPAFNLPVGCLMRTPHNEYEEYHTSADNLDFVQPRALAESFGVYLDVILLLENDAKYRNLNPKCEPQLGRRGLYELTGGGRGTKERELAMLWVLNLSDGDHTLLDIAERSGLDFSVVAEVARVLVTKDLLAPCEGA